MIGWLKKRFGYHVCEEFTQWELINIRYYAAFHPDGTGDETAFTGSKSFMQRACTVCGRVWQKKLKYQTRHHPLQAPADEG